MIESQIAVPLPPGVGVPIGISAVATNGAVGGVDAEGAVSAVVVAFNQRPSRIGQPHDGILLVAMIISL